MENNNKKKEIINDFVEQLRNSKLEEYKNIFEELDSDYDGVITSKKINLSTIDNSLLLTLTPLLELLQKKNIEMDFNLFVKCLDKILNKNKKKIKI
jgi:Ca2+-binding EF-hand superfamily protein